MLTDDLKKKSDELPFKHLIKSEEEGGERVDEVGREQEVRGGDALAAAVG